MISPEEVVLDAYEQDIEDNIDVSRAYTKEHKEALIATLVLAAKKFLKEDK